MNVIMVTSRKEQAVQGFPVNRFYTKAESDAKFALKGSGVTSFSSGNLSPLFTTSVTNPTTTPALSFSLSSAAANTYFGNATGSSTAPSYTAAGSLTKTDDTNVTLTLGGSPTVSLLASTSLTLGWSDRKSTRLNSSH